MKNRWFVLVLSLSLVSTMAWSLEIVPVWEHTMLDTNPPLPILKVSPVDTRWDWSGSEDAPWYGVSLYDQYDGFVRYDANRLLLGLRDNGIDESVAGYDAELAARFPDRSLLWINPGDGSPMGVALRIGFNPVPLSEEYIQMNKGIDPSPAIEGWSAAGDGDRSQVTGTTEHAPEYMNFDISDSGSIYMGYWYMILRWTPDGQGGFTGPVVVYTQDYRNHGGSERLGQWRFGDVEVSGSGANMRAVLSGKTWRNGMQMRAFDVDETSNTWTIRGAYADTKLGCFGTDGGSSDPVMSHDGEEMIYNASSNTDWGVKRFYWDDGADTYQQSPSEEFVGQNVLPDGDPDLGYTHAYASRWGMDAAAHQDLDYIVIGSSPSYSRQNNAAEIDIPAWLTVHTIVGDDPLGAQLAELVFGSTKERPPVESDELSYAGYEAVWSMIMSQVKVYRQSEYADDACEILFLNQILGYGRYTIGDTSVDEWTVY